MARMQQPWDLPRFIQTANFFNGPVQQLKRILPSSTKPLGRDGLIWGAGRFDLLEWGALDDVVMGGASQSNFMLKQDFGIWEGTITTENNGGFAGCRSRAVTPALDVSSFTGIRLRVKGDGKRYKLIVRGPFNAPYCVVNINGNRSFTTALNNTLFTDDYNWNGIAWAYFFDTSKSPSDWETIDAPFKQFVPTLFARSVPGVRLKTNSITTIQLVRQNAIVELMISGVMHATRCLPAVVADVCSIAAHRLSQSLRWTTSSTQSLPPVPSVSNFSESRHTK